PVKAGFPLFGKRPYSAVGVIPARHLSPVRVPEAFLVSTPFPPDDRSLGWERGTTISKEWDSAATDAALETAGYVVSRLGELSGVSETAKDRSVKLMEFAARWAERAFRRPLTAEEKTIFIDR